MSATQDKTPPGADLETVIARSIGRTASVANHIMRARDVIRSVQEHDLTLPQPTQIKTTPPTADMLAECRRVIAHFAESHDTIPRYEYVRAARDLLARLSAEPDTYRSGGALVEEGVPCPDCDGKGFFVTRSPDIPFSRFLSPSEPCDACNGTGRVPEPAPVQADGDAVERAAQAAAEHCGFNWHNSLLPQDKWRGIARAALSATIQTEGDAVERVARAFYLKKQGANPDWPIGVDSSGYHQEPYVSSVPGWKWFYEADAQLAVAALSATARAVNVEAGAQWLAKNVMNYEWGGIPEGSCEPQYPAWKCGHFNASKEDYRIAVREILAAAHAGAADVERETVERCAKIAENYGWPKSNARTVGKWIAAALRALQPAPGKTGGA